MTDDFNFGTIGIHTNCEAWRPNKSIITLSAFEFVGRRIKVFIFGATAVIGIHAESFAWIIGENRTAITAIEVPFPVGTRRDWMQRVIMLTAIETRE